MIQVGDKVRKGNGSTVWTVTAVRQAKDDVVVVVTSGKQATCFYVRLHSIRKL